MILAIVGLIGTIALMALAESVAIAVEPVPLGPAFEVIRERNYEDPNGVFTPGFSENPRISGDPDGNVVFSWRQDDTSRGGAVQKFGPDGKPLAPRFTVTDGIDPDDGSLEREYTYQVDTDTDEKGNFIVFWADTSDDPDGPGFNTFVQLFGADGTPSGKKTRIGYSDEYYIGVDAFEDGRFIVAWPEETCEDAGQDYCVLAKRGAGKSVKNTGLEVNTTPLLDDARSVEVGSDLAGNVLVVWASEDQVLGRIIDLNLNPITAEFPVATTVEHFHMAWPTIIGLDEGFVVAWETGEGGAHARVLDAAGNLQTDFPIAAPLLHDFSAARVDSERFVVAWLARNVVTRRRELRMQLYQTDGTPEGSEFVLDTNVGGTYEEKEVAVGSRGDGRFAVAWDGSYDPADCAEPDDCGLVARLFAISEEPQQVLLPGRKLRVSNVLPDDPERSKAQWLVTGTGIEGVLPGGLSDPRCLFDGPGTVKAGIRFSSASTGHDSGPIGLPCQNWVKLGNTPSRSWLYFDRELDDGPCGQVLLKDGKSINATCKGKNNLASFAYDLEPGVPEPQIDVALRIGSTSYCTSFPPSGSKNGSDGKTFLGKNAPAPGACASGDPIP